MMVLRKIQRTLRPEQAFMVSGLVVNGGNYLYNLVLGRVLGPAEFSDAAILITFLLVLSFVAMTFQLAVAKFAAEFEALKLKRFVQKAFKAAVSLGLLLGALIIVFSKQLQQLFNTQSSVMFTTFGIAIPLYFIMSVNRGRLQGHQDFMQLAGTYQSEMWSRLVITFVLILILQLPSSVAVAIGVTLSCVFGVIPFKKISVKTIDTPRFSSGEIKQIRTFFLLTACYEFTQIICNNSDIFLVKHFFDNTSAGLYASMALIGRVVYFATWLFVMLLLPKVIEHRKNGEDTTIVLKKYMTYIVLFCAGIVSFTFMFPTLTVNLLFGEAYISISPLLGWYALATAFFAMSNVFTYYFLSLDKFVPIMLSGIFGVLQIGLIIVFHHTLFEVVMMQVIAMAILLIAQLVYYQYRIKSTSKLA